MANTTNPMEVDSAETQEVEMASPRKLIRPCLADAQTRSHAGNRQNGIALLAHQSVGPASPLVGIAGHAETLYLQKQMQSQTPMVFVLEDGEKLAGVIEWFDLHVIKVRHGTRTLIYKTCIKYLHKASDLPEA